jgi:hypothetical protein
MLTAEQIQDNWTEFRNRITNNFSGMRHDNLNALYDDMEDRIVMMPASGTEHFHNCFIGGYIDHVLRVMDCAEKLYNVWKESGSDVTGYTLEELLFAAMNHDLGKVGFPGDGNQVYLTNPSEWHRRNLGKLYTHNPEIPFTMVPDLSLWLLQEYGIKVTWNEYLGIKAHDGLYDDSNKPYFISRSKDSKFKNNLPVILHHADHMASIIEYERWNNTNADTTTTTPVNQSYGKKAAIRKLGNIANNNTPNKNAAKLFEDLFGDVK